MADKRITFKAKIDTSEFDQQVTKIQQKLKQATMPAQNSVLNNQVQQKLEKLGIVSPMDAAKKAASDNQMKQSARELEQMLARQY